MNAKVDLYGELQQLHLQLGEIETRDDTETAMSPEEALRISEAAQIRFEQNPGRTLFGDKSKNWFEDYLRLKELGFPWRVATWIAWAASPKKDRWPKTQMELASQVLGLSSDRAIGNWRKKYATIDSVVATLQAAPLIDHRRDIFEALAESASDPDHRHNPDRKLALELTGDYVPHMTVEDKRRSSNDDLTGMSDADLAEAKKRILEGNNIAPPQPLPISNSEMERDDAKNEILRRREEAAKIGPYAEAFENNLNPSPTDLYPPGLSEENDDSDWEEDE